MSDNSNSNGHSKNPDLARIRDNQRRSRARRKEYLQELESKFRICERTGAEASSEIQAAAREVAAENKRLRQLLLQHGIADPELDQSLTPPTSTYASSAAQSPTAASLEHALNTPRPCSEENRRSSSCAPPLNVPSQRRNLQPQQPSPPKQHQQLEPAPYIPTTTEQYQYPVEVPQYPTEDQQYQYPTTAEDQQYQYPTTAEDQQFFYQHQQFIPQTSTSCYDLASVIRSVRPNLGPELEAHLGCSNGQECSIPNTRAFDLLDRLSESQPGDCD